MVETIMGQLLVFWSRIAGFVCPLGGNPTFTYHHFILRNIIIHLELFWARLLMEVQITPSSVTMFYEQELRRKVNRWSAVEMASLVHKMLFWPALIKWKDDII